MLASKYKIYYRDSILVILLFGSLFIPSYFAMATSVSRMSVVNIDGYAGKTTKVEITLEGNELLDREGFWDIYYKEVDGDDNRMDITSWITIEPKDFTIKKGEKVVFEISLEIPKDTETGLWGATSEDAGKEGHSEERRTYIIFKDTPVGGNVYSGLLIPVSVDILPSKNPFMPIINFVRQNLMVVILSTIIIIMAALFFRRKK